MARPMRGEDNPTTDTAADPARIALIIGKAARGDEAAWRELISLYSRRVFALARSRLRDIDLAEEVTQSVFVTVANKLKSDNGGYSEQGKFEPWLFRVAINRIRDEVRRMKRSIVVGGDDHFEDSPARASDNLHPSNNPMLHSLRLAMGTLSETDREIIELRHHAGMSFASIADLLEEPLGTLLARHHRALRKLKDCMNTSQPQASEELL